MKKDFFKVITRAKALSLFDALPRIEAEVIKTRDACDRIASEAVNAEDDVPGFDRSVMDGFAVIAEDTFGASESSPVRLTVVGEVVMGEEPEVVCHAREAIAISTGGMVPEGANGVVMVEHADLDGDCILVKRPIAPHEHTVKEGSDIAKGDLLLASGSKIRPQDIGALAASGITSVSVVRKPRVAILSTGTELVPPEHAPPPAKIRSINTWTLAALCEQYGGVPIELEMVADTEEAILARIREGLRSADIVVISGGSSVGTRDLTLDCIRSFEGSTILANGLALKPGKPTILAQIGRIPVIGLPGHPVSCMVIFSLIVRPIMNRLLSFTGGFRDEQGMAARSARNIASVPGREEYVRVKLAKKDGEWWAEPVPGGSGIISSLSLADGLARIDLESEGIHEGDLVDVIVM